MQVKGTKLRKADAGFVRQHLQSVSAGRAPRGDSGQLSQQLRSRCHFRKRGQI